MQSTRILVVTGALTMAALASPMVPQDQDSVPRRDFMRTKLLFSQNIMEGLTTQNFELIVQGAKEIQQVADAEAWLVYDTPEYKRYSDELGRVVDQLIQAGEDKNLEAAALRYFDMSLQCIDCHKYLRRTRL